MIEPLTRDIRCSSTWTYTRARKHINVNSATEILYKRVSPIDIFLFAIITWILLLFLAFRWFFKKWNENYSHFYYCHFYCLFVYFPGNLRCHIKRVHPVILAGVHMFECDECSCVFKSSGSLSAHKSRAHSTEAVIVRICLN